MELDLQKVEANAREASLEDLLDRVTFYRAGMEPAALVVLEKELRRRGVTAAQEREHEERLERQVLWEKPGLATQCRFCRRPAVRRARRWRRLFGLIPLFPYEVPCCSTH
jgi:hypothetical protein